MTDPTGTAPAGTEPPAEPIRRIRLTDFASAKRQRQRWAMLTSYDQYTAQLFDEAGVWALLVGDSAANNVYGYESTLPVTVDELLPLVRAVVKSTRRAFVIGDLPFGSYEDGPSQALETSIRFMKEGGCHAVKFEGGVRVADQIRKVTDAGIPVMGHIGFTPQSEHQLGGHVIQGRGEGVEQLAQPGLQPEAARDLAVEIVAEARQHEGDEGDDVVLGQDRPEEDRHADESQHGQHIGQGEHAVGDDGLADEPPPISLCWHAGSLTVSPS